MGLKYIGPYVIINLVNNGYNPININNLSNSNLSTLKQINNLFNKNITFFKVGLKDKNVLKVFFVLMILMQFNIFLGQNQVARTLKKR